MASSNQAPPSMGANSAPAEPSASNSNDQPAPGTPSGSQAPGADESSNQPSNTGANQAASTGQPSDSGAAANSGSSQTPGSGNGDAANSGGGQPANAGGDANSGAGTGGDGSGGGEANSGTNSGSSQAADSGGQAANSNGAGDGSAFQLAGTGAPLQPVFNVANAAVDDLTGSSGILHDAVNVADTAGLGAIGAMPAADGHSNLITDGVNLPGNALDGNLNAGLSHVTADLADTGHAATGLADDALGAGGNLIADVANLPGPALGGDGISHVPGDLTGALGSINGMTDGIGGDALHPATGLVGSLESDLQSGPVASVDGSGTSGGLLSGSVGDLNGSSSNGAIHADAGPQSEDGVGIGVLSSSDSGHTAGVNALDTGSGGPQIADLSIASDPNGTSIPNLGSTVPSLNGIGTGGVFGSNGSLLTVNGGNNAGDGGAAGASIGNLNGSSSGHHLIDADAGPQGNTSAGLDILAAPTGSDHTAAINAVDVGPSGPQLVDAGVATAPDIINVPSLNGAGVDGLAGGLPAGSAATGLADAVPAAPVEIDTSGIHDLVPAAITADHGVLDTQGTHII